MAEPARQVEWPHYSLGLRATAMIQGHMAGTFSSWSTSWLRHDTLGLRGALLGQQRLPLRQLAAAAARAEGCSSPQLVNTKRAPGRSTRVTSRTA